MARSVSGYKAGTTRVFIPKSFDNHLDSEPVKITITAPTLREQRALYNHALNAQNVTDEGVNVSFEKSLQMYEAAIKSHVVQISNYAQSDGTPIATGSDLAEHGELDFIVEVASEILEGGKDSEKKLEEPQSLSPATTQALHGTAINAEQRALTSGEIAPGELKIETLSTLQKQA